MLESVVGKEKYWTCVIILTTGDIFPIMMRWFEFSRVKISSEKKKKSFISYRIPDLTAQSVTSVLSSNLAHVCLLMFITTVHLSQCALPPHVSIRSPFLIFIATQLKSDCRASS